MIKVLPIEIDRQQKFPVLRVGAVPQQIDILRLHMLSVNGSPGRRRQQIAATG
jgi:hypothetical protein